MGSISSLDLVVILSFFLVAVSLIILATAVIPTLLQLTKTLNAAEKLTTTLDIQVNNVADNLNKVSSNLSNIKSKIKGPTQEHADSQPVIEAISSKAKIHSNSIGFGIITGLKTYFNGSNR